MQDSYDEGDYKARTSIFRVGTVEFIITERKKLLKK